MTELMRHPKLRQVARDLELPASDDALRDLREHAVERVRNMMTGWTLDTVEDLRMRVSDQLSVKLVFITSDDDIYRIAAEFAHHKLRQVPLPRVFSKQNSLPAIRRGCSSTIRVPSKEAAAISQS